MRDPICVVAIFIGIAPLLRQQFAIAFAVIGMIGIPLALAFGHGDTFVTFFGARIYILHFPLMFLFPAVFDQEDLWKFAKALAAITIGMTVLLALQFYSPPSHFLNVGVGGEGDSVFSGAGGRYRCSGTFSFTNGVSAFYGLAAAMFVAFLASGQRMPKWMWISAGCLMLAMPLAISRTIAFQYVITLVFTVLAVGVSPHLVKNLFAAVIAMAVLLIALSFTPIFQDSVDAFSQRWESATQSEGDEQGVSGVLQNRIWEYDIVRPLQNMDSIPFFGLGIGIGTNVGAKLLTGERAFLVSEGTIGATLGEFGPALGIVVISLKLIFALILAFRAVFYARFSHPASIIVGSFALVGLVLGNPGQPTGLGFIVLGGGFMMLAMSPHASYEQVQN